MEWGVLSNGVCRDIEGVYIESLFFLFSNIFHSKSNLKLSVATLIFFFWVIVS